MAINPPTNLNLFDTIPNGGVNATGYYTPVVNISGYDSQTGQSDAPYNKTLIGDASSNIVGSSENPYLPGILPVYIPTLYQNVYDIQTNLKDAITSDSTENRTYPTSLAVKNYVASQLAGFEYLSGDDTTISTTVSTSILGENNSPTINTNIDTNTITYEYLYTFTSIDVARNGAGKTVINNVSLIPTIINNERTINTMIISAGSQGNFVVLGKTYKYYQFSGKGDTLDMVQFIDINNNSVFFVKTYSGLFLN